MRTAGEQMEVGSVMVAAGLVPPPCWWVVDIAGYVSGKGTTDKGITIGIVKEDNGKTYARAGLAPHCSKGVLAIDEMGQMNQFNLSGLHEVMEQRQCSISKAGHNLTLEADTSILGAANPKYGKYDSEETLLDNINLPAPLLSRFDIIWLIKDDIIELEDQKKAEHILSTYIDPVQATSCFLTTDELSGYLSYVRKLEPKITSEVSPASSIPIISCPIIGLCLKSSNGINI